MKKYEWLRRGVAKLRDRTRLKNQVYGLLAFVLVGFSACEQHGCGEGPEPVGFCGTVPQVCNTFATAENVGCGTGLWQNTWLRLDDGTLLQPYESNTGVTSLTPGQRYKIGYELMTRDGRFDQVVICQAVPPASKTARITCLEADLPTKDPGK